METQTLETSEASIVYDVAGPLPADEGRPLLFMIGQPMTADGFYALASYFADRTVVTYDPRGLGRSTRKDGRVENDPNVQARDLHGLIQHLGAGAVEMFASSGGAITSLALATLYPQDLITLVAHEPPLPAVLPDEALAQRAMARFRQAYASKGFGTGMATFIATTMWQGEFTEDFLSQPLPDPAQFGLPANDDGSRNDPLLSDASNAITDYQPDLNALRHSPVRIVVGVGEESAGGFTGRTSLAVAERLGQEATVFPSHHGGFVGGDTPYAGKPEEFATKLREVLAAAPVHTAAAGQNRGR